MYTVPKGIKPTEIVAGSIAIYENIWENPEQDIKAINDVTSNKDSGVYFTKSQTFEEAEGTDQPSQSIRTNQSFSLTSASRINEDLRKINNKFYEKIISGVSTYCSILNIEQEIVDAEEYQLLKYSGGQHYGAHYDGGTGTARAISPILYLNDDYEGGEIEFVNFGIKIKPKAGSLLIFPSSYAYRHIAHPVTSGTKYAIVTWLHDRH
jgi:Rps23 Pro-64 3,4-dihydroxylase Tpa1-like proline 4-hydroxylase